MPDDVELHVLIITNLWLFSPFVNVIRTFFVDVGNYFEFAYFLAVCRTKQSLYCNRSDLLF